MTQLVYSSWFGDLGGGELRMLDHIRHTTIPRNDIAVLAQADGALLDTLRAEDIHGECVPWKGGNNWLARQWTWYRGWIRCARLLRQWTPEVVLCNTFHDLETTGRVAARLRLPLIWRARADTFTHTHLWPRQRLQALVSFLNSKVARILPTTHYEARLMMEAGVAKEKVRVVHNGVDLSRYEDSSAGKQLRSALGISPQVPVIAFVARMVPQKGYEVLLRALADLKRSGHQFKALIAGDTTLLESDGTAYKAGIHALVSELGLNDEALLLGARKDVHAIMNAADVFVLASLKEPFGTTVIEAMAAGKPVVTSDLPGPRESAIQDETAYFFPPGNADALKDAIARLLAAPELAKQMGERGRRRAREVFSMDAYISAMDEECLAWSRSAQARQRR